LHGDGVETKLKSVGAMYLAKWWQLLQMYEAGEG